MKRIKDRKFVGLEIDLEALLLFLKDQGRLARWRFSGHAPDELLPDDARLVKVELAGSRKLHIILESDSLPFSCTGSFHLYPVDLEPPRFQDEKVNLEVNLESATRLPGCQLTEEQIQALKKKVKETVEQAVRKLLGEGVFVSVFK